MDEQWELWLKDNEEVRALAERVPPWIDYCLKETGQRAQVIAYGEDGTIRALCWHDWSPELTAVQVFGLDPDDFEQVTNA